MRILLIRHGPTAHAAPRGLLDRAGVEEWRAGYDAAGIAADAVPPAELVCAVTRADRVIASDLPRAVESASRLCSSRPFETSPLFREVPLRIPGAPGLRMPLAAWELLIHLQWGLDMLRGRDRPPEFARQLRAAAHACSTACRRGGEGATLVVVTHGVLRRLLAKGLSAEGWVLRGRRKSYACWSVWELTRTHAEHHKLVARAG